MMTRAYDGPSSHLPALSVVTTSANIGSHDYHSRGHERLKYELQTSTLKGGTISFKAQMLDASSC